MSRPEDYKSKREEFLMNSKRIEDLINLGSDLLPGTHVKVRGWFDKNEMSDEEDGRNRKKTIHGVIDKVYPHYINIRIDGVYGPFIRSVNKCDLICGDCVLSLE